MARTLVFSFLAVLAWLGFADAAWAQEWPTTGGPVRGPGQYIAWYKLLPIWIFFICWIRSTSWLGRDTKEVGDKIGLPYAIWNPVVVVTFLLGFICAISIPMFAAGISIMVLSYGVPLTIYIVMRNGKVADDKKVMTPTHIKKYFSGEGRKRRPGAAEQFEDVPVWEQGSPIELFSTTGDAQIDQANEITARQTEGYVEAKGVIADVIDRRAERLRLDYNQQAVGLAYEIDGQWHNAEPIEREIGDVILAILKKLANLNPADRRSRQENLFGAKYRKTKFHCELTTVGTQTGESALLRIYPHVPAFKSLEELGMREQMKLQYQELLAAKQGFVLISSMPSGGLSTSWYMSLYSTDRYLRDFVSIEDKANPSFPVENVPLEIYAAADGQFPDAILPNIILRQPEVFIFPDLHATNGETVRVVCGEVNVDERLAIGGMRAKEAVEALLRVLLLKTPAEDFSQAVTGVLNQRLMRRLCDKCKLPYQPQPQVLQQLGVPADRAQMLYREWTPPQQGEDRKDEGPCEKCGGNGYYGRVAIFELLIVNDQIRQALAGQPKLDVLRQIARQSGHRSLREEGILTVLQGVTSLNELQRVLQQ